MVSKAGENGCQKLRFIYHNKKIKEAKIALRQWAKENHTEWKKAVLHHISRLEVIQQRMEQDFLWRLKRVFALNPKALKEEEEKWCLKSCSLWLRAGDRNTNSR